MLACTLHKFATFDSQNHSLTFGNGYQNFFILCYSLLLDNNLKNLFQSSPAPDTPQDRDGARSRMTSPARDFEMFEDEGDILGENGFENEEEEGEELFGDNMEK